MKSNPKLVAVVIALAALFVASSPARAQVAPASSSPLPQQQRQPPAKTGVEQTPKSDAAPPPVSVPSDQVIESKRRPKAESDASTQGSAQDETRKPQPATRPRQADRLEPDDTRVMPTDVPAEMQANRREQLTEEEAAIVPYYNNFMASYRLGPEDIISIRVFNQDRYSIANITVPPDGRISYWFVRDGLMVTGKTPQQVSEEITKHLDEYIIEPKVTVSLEKAMSARYGVIGDVAQPGIRVMNRRLTVYEALLEAGGVLSTGDKKKVMLLRQQADGRLHSIPIDIAAIEKGKALNNQYLSPGDQVVVPGNRFKTVQKVLSLLPVLSFARIFTGGF